jgi:hypothetical protein
MIFHVVFSAAVLGALAHLWLTRSRGWRRERVVETALLYLLCVQWGFGGVLTSVPHIVVPDTIAGFIGWEPGSPFQVELGFASLGLGVLSIWLRGTFWIAPAVPTHGNLPCGRSSKGQGACQARGRAGQVGSRDGAHRKRRVMAAASVGRKKRPRRIYRSLRAPRRARAGSS